MEKELTLEDGQMINFGNSMDNEVHIPVDELDKEQFTLYNRDGHCYLVDKSNNYPTRIKAQNGTLYRLNLEDYISLGL